MRLSRRFAGVHRRSIQFDGIRITSQTHHLSYEEWTSCRTAAGRVGSGIGRTRRPARTPLRIGVQTWDLVGELQCSGGAREWLLIEAKAHVGEMETSPRCGAGAQSRSTITRAFQKTRINMGITADANAPVPTSWFEEGCYQIANRFAALNFLLHEMNPPAPAYLVFIYFMGDNFKDRMCPRDAAGWLPLIERTNSGMELSHDHRFSSRVHKLFFDVGAASQSAGSGEST